QVVDIVEMGFENDAVASIQRPLDLLGLPVKQVAERACFNVQFDVGCPFIGDAGCHHLSARRVECRGLQHDVLGGGVACQGRSGGCIEQYETHFIGFVDVYNGHL